MVSYVILIVIGVSISVFVYAYLKLYLPAEKQKECEADVKLVITSVSCISSYCGVPGGDLALTVENRGLFNVSGLFIRFGNSTSKVKKLLNANETLLKGTNVLGPGDNRRYNYIDLNSRYGIVVSPTMNHEIEVEPAVLQDGYIVPCKKSIVTYPVTSCPVINSTTNPELCG